MSTYISTNVCTYVCMCIHTLVCTDMTLEYEAEENVGLYVLFKRVLYEKDLINWGSCSNTYTLIK